MSTQLGQSQSSNSEHVHPEKLIRPNAGWMALGVSLGLMFFGGLAMSGK